MRRRTFLNGLALASAGAVVGPTNSLARIASAKECLAGTSAIDSASDETFWREVQQSFSVGRGVINLNNGGLGASPRVVTDAVQNLIREQERLPPYSAFTTFPAEIENVRGALARMFGCDSEELAIVRNTTEALATVLLGVPLKSGDEILTTAHDHWAMKNALRQRELREGVSVKYVNVPLKPASMDELVQAFADGITPRTRLILVSEMVNLTGQIFPVRRICDLARSKGIDVVADGAQTLGQIRTGVQSLGCTYFGTSLHKWLMAPKGTGFLYVSRDRIESTWPLLPCSPKLDKDVRKFEALGTVPLTSLAIAEAVAFHNGIGGELKEERLRFLSRYWVDQVRDEPKLRFLTVMEPEMSCALVTVDIEGIEPARLADHLWEKHRILVSNVSTRADNVRGVRVSPGLYNTREELDVFCEVLTGIAKNGIRE